MSGTARWVQPNFTTAADTSTYKSDIDACFQVASRIVDAFAPHGADVPDMTVTLDPGYVFTDTALTEIGSQTSGTITAPVTHPRIDWAVIDRKTGTLSIITGTEASSPVAPALTTGNLPVCQISLSVGQTTITELNLTDYRFLFGLGNGVVSSLNLGNGTRASSGTLQTNELLSRVSTTQTIAAANHKTRYVVTSSIAFNLPITSSVWNGFGIYIRTLSAVATLTPNAADSIDGATTGATFALPANTETYLTTDAAGHWNLFSLGASGITPGAYTNPNVTLDIFGRITSITSGTSGGYAAKTTSYTALLSDNGKEINFSGLSGNVTLTLPSAVTVGAGWYIDVSLRENRIITVATSVGGQTLDGVSSRKSNNVFNARIMSDGTNFITVSGKYIYSVLFSGLQTWAARSTFAHSLGALPTFSQFLLVCTSAELGYSVGDTVVAPMTQGGNNGIMYLFTSSIFTYGIGNGGVTMPQNTGTAGTITPSKWALLVTLSAE
jgi:hypothetical protein